MVQDNAFCFIVLGMCVLGTVIVCSLIRALSSLKATLKEPCAKLQAGDLVELDFSKTAFNMGYWRGVVVAVKEDRAILMCYDKITHRLDSYSIWTDDIHTNKSIISVVRSSEGYVIHKWLSCLLYIPKCIFEYSADDDLTGEVKEIYRKQLAKKPEAVEMTVAHIEQELKAKGSISKDATLKVI